MKKNILIIVAFLLISLAGQAQIRVNSDGSVQAAYNSSNNVRMNVGTIPLIGGGLPFGSSDRIILRSLGSPSLSANNIGAFCGIGTTTNSLVSGSSSIGVLGIGACSASGKNYGICGITGLGTGAAVIGSTSTLPAMSSNTYAGYFNGDAYVNGTMTATTYTTASDIRLKENIAPLCDVSAGESALDRVMAMNVLQYNYKRQDTSDNISLASLIGEDEEAIRAREAELADKAAAKLHFGLSAQELQEIYPNLVEEGQDGYLSVNYMELVPVLIQCIQELKEEVEELRGGNSQSRKSPESAASVSGVKTSRNQLFQNTPNPAREQTVIRYRLAPDAQNACICIYDLQGKQLRQIPVSTGSDSVNIAAHELGAGIYLYSLIVNNQEVDTKRMILSK